MKKEDNLSDELQVKLGSYINELRDMNNDQLPHYGEALMSSIFAMQQQLVDRQAKLARYIKSQQNIIRLNFFINQDKVIESYALITFEIRKMIVILERYKSKLSNLEEELKLKLIALKSCRQEHQNVIDNHDKVDENIINRMKELTKQDDLMSNIFNTNYLHSKDINNTIEEYNDLYKIYTSCGKVFCNSNNSISGTLYRINSVNDILKNKSQEYNNINDNASFIIAKRTVLLNHFFEDIIRVNSVYDIILNENKLRKLSLMLASEYLILLKSEEQSFNKFERDLAITLIDVDTTSMVSKCKYEGTNLIIHIIDYISSRTYADNLYTSVENDKNIEGLMKIIYAETVRNTINFGNIIDVYNNYETPKIFKILIRILFEKDYSIDYKDLKDDTIEYIDMLERTLNVYGHNNKAMNVINDIYNAYSKTRNINKLDDITIKTWILEFIFRQYSWSCNASYNKDLKMSNYVASSMNIGYNLSEIDFSFTLNREIVSNLFLIFYTGYMIENNFTLCTLSFDKKFFISFFDEVMKIFVDRKNDFPRKMQLFNSLEQVKALKYLITNPWLLANSEYFRKQEYKNQHTFKQINFQDDKIKKELTLDFLHQLMKDKVNEIIKTYSNTDSKELIK